MRGSDQVAQVCASDMAKNGRLKAF